MTSNLKLNISDHCYLFDLMLPCLILIHACVMCVNLYFINTLHTSTARNRLYKQQKYPKQHPKKFFCLPINTLRLRQNGRRFADDTFKRIFVNENVGISINISLKFVPKGLINNIPALVLIIAWRQSGDKPLSEPMIVNLLTHICVTWPQWVKHHQILNTRGIYISFGKEMLH